MHVPGHRPILFDLGTGLRYFGLAQPGGLPFVGTCLLTHLHWDHIQGLPFFTPMLRHGAELDVHAPSQDDGRSVADVFSTTIRQPLFPAELHEFPGTFRFHDHADDEFTIGEVNVMSRRVPHIGPTLGFRLEWNGTTVAYISDHQQPADGSFAATPGALELAAGVDLLIHDSQYTPEEFAMKSTWGHCTVDYAVWFAAQAQAKTLALFHHDPTRHDDALDDLGDEAAKAGALLGVEVIVARESTTVHLP